MKRTIKTSIVTNSQINNVRALRDSLKNLKRPTSKQAAELAKVQSKLYVMRREYHAMLKARKVQPTVTNAQVNAVRAIRDSLRALAKPTDDQLALLARVETKLFALRRIYHAMLAARKAS